MHNQMSDTGSVEPLVLTIKDKILVLVYVSKANLFDTLDCTVFNIHNMTNNFYKKGFMSIHIIQLECLFLACSIISIYKEQIL
jgi:hypothetical protein